MNVSTVGDKGMKNLDILGSTFDDYYSQRKRRTEKNCTTGISVIVCPVLFSFQRAASSFVNLRVY